MMVNSFMGQKHVQRGSFLHPWPIPSPHPLTSRTLRATKRQGNTDMQGTISILPENSFAAATKSLRITLVSDPCPARDAQIDEPVFNATDLEARTSMHTS